MRFNGVNNQTNADRLPGEMCRGSFAHPVQTAEQTRWMLVKRDLAQLNAGTEEHDRLQVQSRIWQSASLCERCASLPWRSARIDRVSCERHGVVYREEEVRWDSVS